MNMKTAILLDGHYARILLKVLIGKNATCKRLKALSDSSIVSGETLTGIYYYDCSPFSKTLPLPMSGILRDFSKEASFNMATKLQQQLKSDSAFHLRRGQLSFDGWALELKSLEDLKKTPRKLLDTDFKPIIKQKQVDLLIGIDIAKMAITKTVERIILVTSDSDFVPAINYAQTHGIKVFLITSDTAKAELRNSCQRRFVDKAKLLTLLPP